jgi:hypothetical protein
MKNIKIGNDEAKIAKLKADQAIIYQNIAKA